MKPSIPLCGQVIATHGRHYLVKTGAGEILNCFPRGKRSLLACGDYVEVMRLAPGQGVIEAVDLRLSLLLRSDRHRRKLIAANVSQIVIVVAGQPSFYEDLLNRCLIAAEHARLAVLIVLNKFDLLDTSTRIATALRAYSELGYRVLPLCAQRDVMPLRSALEKQNTVMIGQSGVGKSTIINSLLPAAGAMVGEISLALDSGRHTTTTSRLYRLDGHSWLIDSPGLQEFGLHHLRASELAEAFPEFRPHLGHCRFADCSHDSEPECALRTAVATSHIREYRLDLHRRLLRELRD